MVVPNPVENPSAVGGGGGGGSILVHELLQFGRTGAVPGAGTLQLYAPGQTLQGAEIIRAGTITGLSLKTNIGDAVRSYSLQARVNGLVTAAVLAFPAGGGNEQFTGGLAVAIAPGDYVQLFLVKTGGAGASSFTDIEATVEITESVAVPSAVPNVAMFSMTHVSGTFSTGALGFTPKLAIYSGSIQGPLAESNVFSHVVGFATGIGALAKAAGVGVEATLAASAVGDDSGGDDDAIGGHVPATGAFQTAFGVDLDVTAFGPGGIDLTWSATVSAHKGHLVVIG